MAVKRFISAMVGLALFFIIIFMPPYIFGAAIFIISLTATYEYNKCLKKAGYNNYIIVSFIPSLLILLALYKFETGLDSLTFIKYAISASLLFFVSFIFIYLLTHKKHDLKDVYSTVFAMVYIAPLFTTMIAVRYLAHGDMHIFLAFGGAWMTDTFAYFSGKLFGKMKLIPQISPNKTVAGAIGGLIGTTVCTVIFGCILNRYVYSAGINISVYIILGLTLAVFAQAGDLIASAIKRQAQIKDFGNLMPGHGGALDRFDSALFSSAVTLAYVLIYF